MRLFYMIAIILAFTAAPAFAQGTAKQEDMQVFAKRYYANCMTKKDEILKGENQKMLCACSAKKLGDNMTIDNLKAMSQQTADGELQRKRLLLEVYAPCLEFPAKALLYENCVTGTEVKTKLKNYEAVCGCMAKNMGVYIAKNGPATIEESLRLDPTNPNPLAGLMNSPNFQAQAQAELVKCIPLMMGK